MLEDGGVSVHRGGEGRGWVYVYEQTTSSVWVDLFFVCFFSTVECGVLPVNIAICSIHSLLNTPAHHAA